jgi:WD40 repeat protein
MLASAMHTGAVQLWDLTTGRVRRTLAGHSRWVINVAFSPSGDLLASASADGTIRLWRTADGTPHGPPLDAAAGAANSVAFSPDGATLAAGYQDGRVQLWRVADGSALGPPLGEYKDKKEDAVNSVAFSPDGARLVSASEDRIVRLWQLDDRRLLHAFEQANKLWGVVFSRDGATIAVASEDKTLQILHAQPDWSVARSLSHPNPLRWLAIAPNGALLASTSLDGTVQLWRSTDAAPTSADSAPGIKDSSALATFNQERAAGVLTIAFSSNGAMFATGSFDGTIRLWGIAPD